MTEDLLKFFNGLTDMNLTPVFDQYLRHAELPTLELRFQESDGAVSYRWKAAVREFAMPVRVGRSTDWQLINPTTEWQTMKTELKKEEFEVATDRYYVDVSKN